MLQRLRRTLFSLAVLFALTGLLLAGWLKATAATPDGIPLLRTGDIVFQTSRSSQSLAIMLASKSPLSHMGIVDMEAAGGPTVVEATATTRETPLADWIERGLGGRLEVMRLRDIAPEHARAVIAAARSHLGKPYDLFFRSTRDELYCSELVDYAFHDGINVSLGRYQTLASLDLDNFAARKVIERRWQKHPDCSNAKAASAAACLAILKQQSLITPQSIAEDPRLQLIYSNYALVPQ